MIPQQWHVYIVDLEPRVGTRPGKRRPCLAIQPDEFGEVGLSSTVVLPITTQLAKEEAYPLRVRIPKGSCQLDRESDLIVDQVLAWDNALFREDLGAVPLEIRVQVRKALKEFLDLD
jgi:mRNA interferase MazF